VAFDLRLQSKVIHLHQRNARYKLAIIIILVECKVRHVHDQERNAQYKLASIIILYFFVIN
jgi:hypothetical protein